MPCPALAGGGGRWGPALGQEPLQEESVGPALPCGCAPGPSWGPGTLEGQVGCGRGFLEAPPAGPGPWTERYREVGDVGVSKCGVSLAPAPPCHSFIRPLIHSNSRTQLGARCPGLGQSAPLWAKVQSVKGGAWARQCPRATCDLGPVFSGGRNTILQRLGETKSPPAWVRALLQDSPVSSWSPSLGTRVGYSPPTAGAPGVTLPMC